MLEELPKLKDVPGPSERDGRPRGATVTVPLDSPAAIERPERRLGRWSSRCWSG